MATSSGIEWTGSTWNPIAGCTRISPGCQHCYAERMAKRLAAMGQEKYQGMVDKNGHWTSKLNRADEAGFNEPLRNKKPTVYFVNSMSDLFHESIPEQWLIDIWDVMRNTPQHTYQILTKRADVMAKRVGWLAILPNVWLGVSVENQKYANERIPYLLKTPAAVRFLSCEPLLGPVRLADAWLRDNCFIDWVIVGGESGPDARPMNPDWARSIRDQCTAAGVSFFFKQWGQWFPFGQSAPGDDGCPPGKIVNLNGHYYQGIGKQLAGRLLDGRTWDEMPVISRQSEARVEGVRK